MKTKGLRKSKNIQDARARGPEIPSNLSVARDRKQAERYWEGKDATASKSKMAKDAGIDATDKKKKLPSRDGNVYKGKR
jgi:hypothetical protein